ncbi:hypothetical protein EC843_101678 [Buttiauxella sp. JUb87]|jgi:flagellar capping protein FliD|uniref:hypothetical protein n=1 Tax=Buttiauxella sp. JUb87 TaxID=2485129 RepID=UPI00105F069D|nr:hypothetical protein [Buttiauxella sp. JUb87]TDN54632.1 hypothetical protein EC843_101678 [Buttiauxella sp. JUb87]
MSDPLSLNTVKIHLSELPPTFSEKLKSFFSRQPAFNDEVKKRLSSASQAIQLLTQEQAALKKRINSLENEINTMKQQNK